MTTAEQFLITTLTNPQGMGSTELYSAALDAGVPWEQIRQPPTNLAIRTTPSGPGQAANFHLDRGACIVCGTTTPYIDPNHRLHICPGCTSPITTCRWERHEGAPRRGLVTILAAQHTGGWPSKQGQPQPRLCGTPLNRALPDSPTCPEAALWKITITRGRSQHVSTSHHCDSHLNPKNRPAIEEK